MKRCTSKSHFYDILYKNLIELNLYYRSAIFKALVVASKLWKEGYVKKPARGKWRDSDGAKFKFSQSRTYFSACLASGPTRPKSPGTKI
jgi:hypothetical protein